MRAKKRRHRLWMWRVRNGLCIWGAEEEEAEYVSLRVGGGLGTWFWEAKQCFARD